MDSDCWLKSYPLRHFRKSASKSGHIKWTMAKGCNPVLEKNKPKTLSLLIYVNLISSKSAIIKLLSYAHLQYWQNLKIHIICWKQEQQESSLAFGSLIHILEISRKTETKRQRSISWNSSTTIQRKYAHNKLRFLSVTQTSVYVSLWLSLHF